MKNKVCSQLEVLQDFLDEESCSEMGQALREHLYGTQPCLECRKFYDEYIEFRNLLSAAADSEVPDVAVISSRKTGGNHLRTALFVSAALITILIGSFYGLRSYLRYRIISADTTMYVSGLIEAPLLEISDYKSTIPDDWFDSPSLLD
ncbi:MAG TPA: hypothetical protein DCO79_07570 [Spirochaeta sp.]|nr:hypothetical protein [Spirochaeta sp.]